MVNVLDIRRICDILPHRYPFLLIDKVIAFEPGVYAEAIKNVSVNEWFFQGHFPQDPIFPGALLVEAMAQTAGIAMLSQEDFSKEIPSVLYFVKMDNVRFNSPVRPGDCLKITSRWERSMMQNHRFECTAKVDANVVASATITARLGV